MKFALLAALVTLTAAQYYSPSGTSLIFKPGVEYIYHYKGHVLNGIPSVSKQYAGIVIDTHVILQFQQDYKVVMKLEKIKLFKVNHEITTKPLESLNENELTLLTGEHSVILTESLIKPIKFRYVEGEVRELEKETEDRFWSVNIKKGILSLLQVTLKDKSSTTDPTYYDPTMSFLKQSGQSNIPFWKLPRKSNSVYKVMETDVTGTCETRYSVISDKTSTSTSSSSISTMRVTAIRDFDSCVTEPFHIKGLFQGVYNYDEEDDILRPMVHTDYVITGDRTHFLIKEATLRGKYSFMLHGLDGGDMSTFILQKLTLKTSEPIRVPVRLTSPKPCTLGLMMVIPDSLPERKTYEEMPSSSWLPSRSSRDSFRSSVYEMDSETETLTGSTTEILSTVDRELTELIECMYNTVTEKPCSIHVIAVDRIIRRLTKDKLKPFLERIIRESENSETEYKKKEILLDIMSTTSSSQSGETIIELIREQLISPLRGSLMVSTLSLTVKPTPSIVRSLLDTFKGVTKESTSSSKLGSKTLLRQSLLLGVGTVTHRMINVMRSHGKPQPEILNFLDSISSEMKRMLDEANTDQDNILVLKTMGNMGAMQTIPIITSYVQDTRQTLPVRTAAIFALRRLAKQFKPVIPTLMSVYMDSKEERELRQAAFIVVISSNPGFSTLEMIAHKLRHEHSSQIRSLVYTSLVNLATHTSHQPEHKQLKENVRLILKDVRPVPIGPHDSVSVMVSQYIESLDMGASVKLLKIKSKNSGLPEAIITKFDGMLLGKHRRLLEVGAAGKSLEVLIRKVFGPHGLLKEILKGKITVEDFMKPLTKPRMGEVEYKIKEILQKMMVEISPEERPFATWYVHVLSNELQYIFLNTETVEDLFNKVSTKLPELLLKLTHGLKVDIIKSVSHLASLTVSSPIGLPLSLNYSTTGVVKVNGHIKVTNLPTWSNIFNRETLPELSVEVDLKPHVDIVNIIGMGVNMRWLSALVGVRKEIKSHVPVKVVTTVHPHKHVLSVKYFVPKETFLPLSVKLFPATLIKYFPTNPLRLPYQIAELKEITNPEFVKTIPIAHTYQCSLSGVTFEVEGKLRVCGPIWCPKAPLFGSQTIKVIGRPTSSVEYVHLKVISLRSNFDLEGIPSTFNTETEFRERERENLESVYLRGRIYPESTTTITEEFDTITPDTIFSSDPIKRQILVTLSSNTLHTPKVKGLFTWLMGRSYSKHQFNAQITRSSYESTPSLKVYWNTVVNPLAWNIETINSPYETRTEEYLTKSTLKWTVMGEKQEIKIKVLPGSPIDFSKELKEHSILSTITLPEARVQKYKFTVELEFTHMGKKTQKMVTLSHDAIRYLFLSHVTTGIPSNAPSNKVLVAVELLPWWEQMNVIVKTPLRNSYITKIPLYINPLFPTKERLSLHDTSSWSWYTTNTTEEDKFYGMNEYETETSTSTYFKSFRPYKSTPLIAGECTIEGSSMTVNTFDDSSSFVPIKKYLTGGCNVVLTQDCSGTGLFSIIASGLTTESWKIKHFIPQYEIEVIKTRVGTPIIKVNGEERRLPYEITDERVVKIEKIEEGKILLKFHELGITVIVNVDSSTIKIKLSPVSPLQGQLCGLCGNYNLDQSDEYKVPEYMKVPSTRSFYQSSLIPSDTCDIDRLTIEPEDDEECTEESLMRRIREVNGVEVFCTSEREIKRCKPHCKPRNTELKKVCFKCERGESTSSRTSYSPYWDSDISITCKDSSFEVEEPTTCVPKYL